MQENPDEQIIKTIGENGEEIFMKIVEVVNVNQKEYALLSVVEDGKVSDELVIMKMNKTDEECTFEIIEDDDEFNFVVAALEDDEQ